MVAQFLIQLLNCKHRAEVLNRHLTNNDYF